MSGSLFLFLTICGKVVLLRSVSGKLMTRVKRGKFSELKYCYEKKFLFRIREAVPKSSILYKFRQSSIRKENVCFKYFVGISAKSLYLGTTIIKVCTRILNSIIALEFGTSTRE